MGGFERNSGWGGWDIIVLVCIIGFVIWVARPNLSSNGRLQPYFVCINNLCQLTAAKNVWVYEQHLTKDEIVTMDQLTNCLRPPVIRKCPSGGIYKIGKVGESVTCSLGTNANPPHVFR